MTDQSAEREPHWSAGAIGRIPDDDSLVFRDDAVYGKQFYAASPSEAEAAARFLNEIEDRADAKPDMPALLRRADEALKRAREALYGNHSFVWAARADERLTDLAAILKEMGPR
jgi:hypothetical protein